MAMSTKPRRISSWKVLGILSGAIIVCITAFFLWMQYVAARKWALMESQVAELLQEAKSRSGNRRVLRGISVPGNAWEDYSLAVEQMRRKESEMLTLAAWFLDR